MAYDDMARHRRITRAGDVFVDSKYAGRVIKSGRRWGAERWVRGGRPGHVALGDSYRTQREAAEAIVRARQAEPGP